MEKKKQLIILVLRMLESESDAQHPLTQTEMTKVISEIYPCDRKTVCRNVQFLREMGYPIVKTTKGFYMDNKAFSNAEIAFVEKAILAAEDLSNEEKKTLCSEAVCSAQKQLFDALVTDGYNVEWVDMRTYTKDYLGRSLFPDMLHPNNEGYRRIGFKMMSILTGAENPIEKAT